MDNDVAISENECEKCGALLYWRPCHAVGCDDGWVDMHEYDDPLWYDPGDVEMCEDCHGKGFVEWCPECGWCPGEDPEP